MFTTFLSTAVRELGVISLEEAIHLTTDVPAQLYGLRGRGTVRPGSWADLVIFDPDAVGSGVVKPRTDLPGGAMRLYSEPTGVHEVIVNGVSVARDNALTGALPGSTIRSGRDTTTPDIAFRSN